MRTKFQRNRQKVGNKACVLFPTFCLKADLIHVTQNKWEEEC